jgi:hypothetical protein
MGTESFPGVRRTGRGIDHPPASSAEVKKRVELYLYSPSGPSWPVRGRPLPLPSTLFIYWTAQSTSHIIGFKWLNDWKVKNLIGYGRNLSCPHSQFYPDIFLVIMRNIMKILSRQSVSWLRFESDISRIEVRRSLIGWANLPCQSIHVQIIPRPMQQLRSGKTWSKAKFAQVGIEYANGQLYVHVKEVQVTSQLQHTGTWPAAVRPVRRPCYRPAAFYRHLRLIALSFP